MKVKRTSDGTPQLTGFGPPAIADPLPGAVAVTAPTSTPAAAPDPAAHTRERVYTSSTAPAPAAPASTLPDKPAAQDTEVYNKNGEKLHPWPCSLCLLVGRKESANGHPMQRCHANP